MFLGFVTLGETFVPTFLTRSGDTPLNAASLPTFRIYGPDGLITSGTCSFKNSGSITGATNANPIVITSTSHGLTNGTRVTITGVGGNTAANTTVAISNVTASTFELTATAGNGSYTSGGTWNVSGLYKLSQAVTAGNTFESGETYTILLSATVNSAAWGQIYTFGVV